MTEEQAGKASLEELKRDALKHYEYVSAVAHYWSNLIPKAIEAYNPDLHTQFLSYLDEEIQRNEDRAAVENRKIEPYFAFQGAADALELAKEKYNSLINTLK